MSEDQKPYLPLGVGIHADVNEKRYHEDPCAVPSLSASIAKLLIGQSAFHGWAAHPRLGGMVLEEEDEKEAAHLTQGTLMHKLLLGKGAEIDICEEDSWRKNTAKELREKAQAEGRIPCLRAQFDRAEKLRDAVTGQLEDLGLDRVFRTGLREVVVVWEDEGVLCRAMIDNLIIDETAGRAEIWDCKTTGKSAHPTACAKYISGMGYDIQRAFYRRAVEVRRPDLAGRIDFRFVFVEMGKPHAITPIDQDGTGAHIGVSKMGRALAMWRNCLAAGKWPGYTSQAVPVTRSITPNWAMTEEMETPEPSRVPSKQEQETYFAELASKNK